MIWLLAIVLFLILFICWILTAPLQIEIDTRIPAASFRWKTIGHAAIWYDEEWMIDLQLLFYHKQLTVWSLIKSKSSKTSDHSKKKKKVKQRSQAILFKKAKRVIRSFAVKEWRLALDTGNYTRNAQLYPLNFIPPFANHIVVNFTGENYFVLKIQNRAWKIIYALLR